MKKPTKQTNKTKVTDSAKALTAAVKNQRGSKGRKLSGVNGNVDKGAKTSKGGNRLGKNVNGNADKNAKRAPSKAKKPANHNGC